MGRFIVEQARHYGGRKEIVAWAVRQRGALRVARVDFRNLPPLRKARRITLSPRKLGGFVNQLHFRLICDSCNSRIGEAEGKLVDAGPEAVARDIVAQAIGSDRMASGSNRKVKSLATSKGGETPLVHTRRGKLYFTDFIEVRDDHGEKHQILLPQKLTTPQLRRKIEAEIPRGGIRGVRLCCSDAESDHWFGVIGELCPDARLEVVGSIPVGPNRTLVRHIFTVTADYFRAIAKIAFHYYLTVSGEDGAGERFADIRNFVRWNQTDLLDKIFTIEHPFCEPGDTDGTCPYWWCHYGGYEEGMQGVRGYVRLFVGPRGTGIPYTVWVSRKASRLLLPRRHVAHCYSYYRQRREDGCEGEVRQIMNREGW